MIIPKETLTDVCKLGQGSDCCRYITAGAAGIECAKHTGLKAIIDKRVEEGTFTAQGDNCEGLK